MANAIVISIDENLKLSVETIKCSVKRNKGKSLLSFLDDYVVVDLETTGLDARYNSIIEIGAIRYEQDQEVDRFHTLINPQCEIPEYIETKTGITNAMVADAPIIEDVIGDILSFISDSVVVAHNANFDVNFLYEDAQYHNNHIFDNDFVDTLRLSKRINKDLPNHKLETLCEYFNVPQSVQHRAIEDCIRTHGCYMAMKDIVARYPERLVADSDHFNSLSKHITPETTKFNPDSPFLGKYVAITGKLDGLTRKQALQLVANLGGYSCDGVTQQTNLLILGNNDYCKSIKGGKSDKQKKAEKMLMEGRDIQIISENVFYEMVLESLPQK